MQNWSTLGLIFDIVGAILIVLGILSTSRKSISVLSGTFYGGNTFLYNSLLHQKNDTLYGLMILIIGFLYQILGSVQYRMGTEYYHLLHFILPMILFFWTYQKTKIHYVIKNDKEK